MRRQTLLKKVNDSPILLLGNILRNRINDTEFEFRQESNFFYLSGLNEENAILLMSAEAFEVNGKLVNEVIFVPENDLRFIAWNGKRIGTKGAIDILGFEAALPITQYENFIESYLFKHNKLHFYSARFTDTEYKEKRNSYSTRYIESLKKALKERLSKTLETDKDKNKLILENQELIQVNNPRTLYEAFKEMREVKSDSEIKMLQRAVDISNLGHHESMKISAHVEHEYQVEAAIEYAFKFHGAEAIGYNSIVGCGANGTILHYMTNRDRINPNEMFVLDAGAEFKNYTADITRSFPANGTFNNAQKDIYQIVLDAQKAAEKVLVAGSNYSQVNHAIISVIGPRLKSLGIIKYSIENKTVSLIEESKSWFYVLAEDIKIDEKTLYAGTPYFAVQKIIKESKIEKILLHDLTELREVMPHGWGHHIGLDVHDPGSSENYKVGMVFTIEPGVYISDRISFKVDEKYLNIGVRIEDMYLITKDGNLHMSKDIPREIVDIEKLMKEKSKLILNTK